MVSWKGAYMIVNEILTINGEGWLMRIDLDVLVKTTGVKEYYVDTQGKRYSQIMTKKSEAKRICKFIIPYLSEDEMYWVAEDFAENAALLSIWLKECRRKGYELCVG